MPNDERTIETGKAGRWTGRALSGLVILFLAWDGVMKLVQPEVVVKGTVDLGYPVDLILPIGLILLACVILYAIPRTAVLGAILLTGYLGGAVATNLRVGNPLFLYVLFPVYVSVLAWLGLYLRDAKLRRVLVRG